MNNTLQDILSIYKDLKKKNALIHCITNQITINDSANAILALGQSPVMAEHPLETYSFTKNAGALLLNLGNISAVKMEAMKNSLQAVKDFHVPTVLDLTGVSASALRRDFALEIMATYPINVIKGNYNEVLSLYKNSSTTRGVDASFEDIEKMMFVLDELSEKYQSIFLASGEKDIVSYKGKLFTVSNGHQYMTKVTGTGCIQGAIIACSLAHADSIESVLLGAVIMGIAGEKAYKDNIGLGQYHISLIDEISWINESVIKKYIKIEEIK